MDINKLNRAKKEILSGVLEQLSERAEILSNKIDNHSFTHCTCGLCDECDESTEFDLTAVDDEIVALAMKLYFGG
jgi:hypothetical protein